MNEPATDKTGRGGRGVLVAAALALLLVIGLMVALRGGDVREAALEPAAGDADVRRARAVAAELRRRALFESLGRLGVLTVDLSGTVYSTFDGAGIPGATVTLVSGAGRIEAVSGTDGAWSARVPAGIHRVSARAEGYVNLARAPLERLPGPPALAAGHLFADFAPVVVADADRGGVDLHLVPGARVHGTVRNRAGRPVAGVVVRGAGIGGFDRGIRVAAGTDTFETGPDGAFFVEVPVGPVMLEAVHDDYAGLEREEDGLVFVGAGEDVAHDLVLAEGCIIIGAVVDELGGSLGDGAIERWIGGSPPIDYRPAGRFEGGRFSYSTTETGRVRLRAWPWKSAPSPPLDIDCHPGARYDGVVLVVPHAEPDLSGVVVTRDGELAAGAHIDVMPLEPGGLPQQERADDRGEWGVFAQPPGRYLVMSYVPGEGAASTRAVVPSRDVRLVLGGTGSVRGSVRGVRQDGFTFSVDRCRLGDDPWPVLGQWFEASPARLVRVSDGRFVVHDLPACRIQATAVAAGRRRTLAFDVVADETVEIDLDFGDHGP